MRTALRTLLLTLLAPVVAGAQAATPEENLTRLNITLPAPPAAGGNDLPAVRAGNLLFLSATGPAHGASRVTFPSQSTS